MTDPEIPLPYDLIRRAWLAGVEHGKSGEQTSAFESLGPIVRELDDYIRSENEKERSNESR